MDDETITPGPTPGKPKRAVKRYWKEINGKLYARFQYQDETGKRREKLKPITDKRTAQSAVAEMRKELENHGTESLQSDKITFFDLATRYEETKLIAATYSNGVKIAGRKSVASPKSAIKPLKEYFGKRHIRTIKAADIEAYKHLRMNSIIAVEHNRKIKLEDAEPNARRKYRYEKEIVTRPRTVAAVNRELEQLRAMFNFAIENDWLIRNPFAKKKGIISRAGEVERDRVLTFDEEKRLLAACTGRRAHLKPILICALDTAMRRGEMFKLRWRDVNFEAGEIKIIAFNSKTEIERTVGITPRLKIELENLWERSQRQPDVLVFGVMDTIKKAWKTACDAAGVNNFKLHDCRHTATTRMIAAGVPHVEAMKITGHTQLKTFLRYLNITPGMVSGCVIKLSAYLLENQ